MNQDVRLITALFVASASVASGAMAQCGFAVAPGSGQLATSGSVSDSVLWDPDGAGPLPEQVVAVGSFSFAGNGRGVALLDTTSWTFTGIESSGTVVAATDGGPIYAVRFGTIQRYDGSAWSTLASLSSSVTVGDMVTLPGGELLVVGQQLTIGGVGLGEVAMFDGTAWTSLASAGFAMTKCVEPLSGGGFAVGGQFSNFGGVTAGGFAIWNAGAWSSPSAAISNGGKILDILELPNGDVVVGGTFTSIDGVACQNVARWDGTAWSPMGAGLSGEVAALALLPSGEIAAGGLITSSGGTAIDALARWDGSSWSTLAGGVSTGWVVFSGPTITTLTVTQSGALFVGGKFEWVGAEPTRGCGVYDGSAWLPLEGIDYVVTKVEALADGDVLVGGNFRQLGSTPARQLARWDGQAWSEVGGGFSGSVYGPGTATFVHDLLELPSGEVVVAGDLDEAGGIAVGGIAGWDGQSWSDYGGGAAPFNAFSVSSVRRLLLLPNGDLLAGGEFATIGGVASPQIARWDGAAWLDVGAGLAPSGAWVNAIATLPSGEVVVGGRFSSFAGGAAANLLVWDGVNWATFGGGANGEIRDLVVAADGSLFACGSFSSIGGVAAGRVARWDGAAWDALGGGLSSTVWDLEALPNGSVLAVGQFGFALGPPQVSVARMARWDGIAWSPFGPGLDNTCATVDVASDGVVWAGGAFRRVGAEVSPYLARFEPTCPAAAVSIGTGCVGANGPDQLTALELPWLGGTFRSEGSGLPTGPCVVVDVRGRGAAQVPLPPLLPQAAAGCELLTTPDVLGLALPSGGGVATSISVPVTVALVGQTFRQQLVAFELDQAGAIVTVTSSNALLATIGSL